MLTYMSDFQFKAIMAMVEDIMDTSETLEDAKERVNKILEKAERDKISD